MLILLLSNFCSIYIDSCLIVVLLLLIISEAKKEKYDRNEIYSCIHTYAGFSLLYHFIMQHEGKIRCISYSNDPQLLLNSSTYNPFLQTRASIFN
jgi:hypothetical protein